MVDMKKLTDDVVIPFFGHTDSNILYFRYEPKAIEYVTQQHEYATCMFEQEGISPPPRPLEATLKRVNSQSPTLSSLFPRLGFIWGLGSEGRLVFFGCPGIGKTVMMNFFALMAIAQKVPLSMYCIARRMSSSQFAFMVIRFHFMYLQNA
jgi:hypothetical protein